MPRCFEIQLTYCTSHRDFLDHGCLCALPAAIQSCSLCPATMENWLHHRDAGSRNHFLPDLLPLRALRRPSPVPEVGIPLGTDHYRLLHLVCRHVCLDLVSFPVTYSLSSQLLTIATSCWNSYMNSYLQVVYRLNISNAGYVLNSLSLTSAIFSPFIAWYVWLHMRVSNVRH